MNYPVIKIHEVDYGTPRRTSEQEVTLEIDGNQVTVRRRYVADACGGGRRHPGAQALRHRQPGAVRLLPPVPWSRSKAGVATPPVAPRPPKPA